MASLILSSLINPHETMSVPKSGSMICDNAFKTSLLAISTDNSKLLLAATRNGHQSKSENPKWAIYKLKIFLLLLKITFNRSSSSSEIPLIMSVMMNQRGESRELIMNLYSNPLGTSRHKRSLCTSYCKSNDNNHEENQLKLECVKENEQNTTFVGICS